VHVNAVLEYWIGPPDGALGDDGFEPADTEPQEVPSAMIALAGLFLHDAPMRIAAIETAVTRTDARALRDAAGTLCRISRTLGAARVTELCLELEQIGAAGSVADAAPLVSQLKESFALTRRAVERKLASARR